MKLHYPLLLWIVLASGCSGVGSSTAAAEQPPSEDMKKLLETCKGCHKPAGPLDLGKNSRSELRAKLEAVRSGKKQHPTDMSKFTDAQLDEIAANLSGKK